MNITTTLDGAQASLALAGRFDFAAHREFRGASKALIDNAKIREITVDFQQVDYIDSSALGMLLLLRQGAQEGGKIVKLRPGNGAVAKILEIANFAKLFAFV